MRSHLCLEMLLCAKQHGIMLIFEIKVLNRKMRIGCDVLSQITINKLQYFRDIFTDAGCLGDGALTIILRGSDECTLG